MTAPTEVAKTIRAALRRRSGKDWTVRCGRGTAWDQLRIIAPPRRCVYGDMTPEDRVELAGLLGLENCRGYGVHVQYDTWDEFIARAEGTAP